MINWLKLGSKIQDMRRLRQITQQQLAERLKISDVYIGYIEQGKRRCSIENYIRIANLLGCTLDDLFAEYLTCRTGVIQKSVRELLEEFGEEEAEEITQIIHTLVRLAKRQKETSSQYYSTAQKPK